MVVAGLGPAHLPEATGVGLVGLVAADEVGELRAHGRGGGHGGLVGVLDLGGKATTGDEEEGSRGWKAGVHVGSLTKVGRITHLGAGGPFAGAGMAVTQIFARVRLRL